MTTKCGENLVPMAKYIETDPETDGSCRPCRLAAIVGDYQQTLEEAGFGDLATKIVESMQDKADPIGKVAAAMDEAKEQVVPEVKEALLELDCMVQNES